MVRHLTLLISLVRLDLKLKNESSLFRNGINPLLEEYVTKFTEEISKVSNISPISKYKVEPYTVPSIAKRLTVKDNKSLTGVIPDTGLNFTILLLLLLEISLFLIMI